MQVNEITALFDTIDTNGDGQISSKEMKKSLKSLSEEQKSNISFLVGADGKLNKSAFRMLADGDKKISKNDLLDYLTTTDEEDNVVELTDEQQESRNNILDILSSADRKKDGKITKGELKKAYKKAVKNSDTEAVEYLENFMTTNSKGKKVVDKSTFKYIATSVIVNHTKSRGKLALKNYLGIYGTKISVSTKHSTRAATFNDFTKLDNDGDYNLSESEKTFLNEYENFFYTIDSKQDGRISKKDIIKAYKNAPEGSETKEMLSSLVTVSSDNKVKINKENFRTLAQGKKYLNSTDMLSIKSDNCETSLTADEVELYLDDAQGFMSLDTNDDGKLTLKELKKAAKNGSDSSLVDYFASIDSSKEKKKIFKQLSNGEKYISFEDIKSYDTDYDGFLSDDEVEAMFDRLD